MLPKYQLGAPVQSNAKSEASSIEKFRMFSFDLIHRDGLKMENGSTNLY